MTTATATTVSADDLEAIKDFPRRAAAIQAEVKSMHELALRLMDSAYAGADDLPHLVALEDGFGDNYVEAIAAVVEDIVAAGGDEGAYLYRELILRAGLSLSPAGAIAELENRVGEVEAARQMALIRSYALTLEETPPER